MVQQVLGHQCGWGRGVGGRVWQSAPGHQPSREDVPYAESNLVYQEQTTGRFTRLEDVFDPAVPVEASHGVAHGDINGDGRVDLIMVSRDGPAQMWLSNSELEHPPATQINVQTSRGTPPSVHESPS